MFSKTTTALSTNIPTANARPARLMTFSERPIKPNNKNVPITLTGIAKPTTRAPRPNHSPNPSVKSNVSTKNHGETKTDAIALAAIKGMTSSVRRSRCRNNKRTIIVSAPPTKIFC